MSSLLLLLSLSLSNSLSFAQIPLVKIEEEKITKIQIFRLLTHFWSIPTFSNWGGLSSSLSLLWTARILQKNSQICKSTQFMTILQLCPDVTQFCTYFFCSRCERLTALVSQSEANPVVRRAGLSKLLSKASTAQVGANNLSRKEFTGSLGNCDSVKYPKLLHFLWNMTGAQKYAKYVGSANWTSHRIKDLNSLCQWPAFGPLSLGLTE